MGRTVTPPRTRTAGVLLVAAAVVYFVGEAVAALAWTSPRYSYARNYISDLGVPGPTSHLMGRTIDSPLAWVMNTGFIGHGALFLAAAILLVPVVRGPWRVVLLTLALVHAVGITLVGVVHGSAWSIEHGLFVWHSLGANMAIGGGNLLAILVGGIRRRLGALRRWAATSIVLGGCGFLGLVLLALRTPVPDGVFERAAVYPLFAWDLFVGLTLLRGPRR